MRKGIFVLFVTRPKSKEIIFLYDFGGLHLEPPASNIPTGLLSFLSVVPEIEILYFSIMGAVGNTNIYKNILRNYTYTGNLLLQQTYSENHLTKCRQRNNGEFPMYHIQNAHEAIIPLEQFNAVQEEIKRRAALLAGMVKWQTPGT